VVVTVATRPIFFFGLCRRGSNLYAVKLKQCPFSPTMITFSTNLFGECPMHPFTSSPAASESCCNFFAGHPDLPNALQNGSLPSVRCRSLLRPLQAHRAASCAAYWFAHAFHVFLPEHILSHMSLFHNFWSKIARPQSISCRISLGWTDFIPRASISLRTTARRVYSILDPREHYYLTPKAKAEYWKSADQMRCMLYGSNAKAIASMEVSLPLAYVPRLTIAYRDRRKEDPAVNEGDLSVDEYKKWHRMVFPELVRSLSFSPEPLLMRI
jgi:hypothetical protein